MHRTNPGRRGAVSSKTGEISKDMFALLRHHPVLLKVTCPRVNGSLESFLSTWKQTKSWTPQIPWSWCFPVPDWSWLQIWFKHIGSKRAFLQVQVRLWYGFKLEGLTHPAWTILKGSQLKFHLLGEHHFLLFSLVKWKNLNESVGILFNRCRGLVALMLEPFLKATYICC